MPALKRAFVLCCCIFYLLFPRTTHAYFIDDFSDGPINSDVWQSYQNAGSIVVENGKLSLLRSATPAKSFPYIHSRHNIFPETGPFSIFIKYRFLTTGNFGDGIVISPLSSPSNGVDSGTNITDFNIFGIWQDFPTGLLFDKIMCNIDSSGCSIMEFLKPFTHIPDYAEHEVQIDYTESGQYLIYLDGTSEPVYISATDQRRPKSLWMGNSLLTSTNDYWSSFEVEYIKVLPITKTNPIILIPGFGASCSLLQQSSQA